MHDIALNQCMINLTISNKLYYLELIDNSNSVLFCLNIIIENGNL